VNKNLIIVRLLLGYICLFISNVYIQNHIPFTYFDEPIWISRSYFFDVFVKGDFTNPIWQSFPSYDQPKLAEYAYGAWLYPIYLAQKHANPDIKNYGDFLSFNGISLPEGNSTFLSPTLNPGDVGYRSELIDKYGSGINSPLNLIQSARLLNAALLPLVVILAFFLFSLFSSQKVAIVATLLYATNPNLLTSGLLAHSETLFLFFFNAALLLLALYSKTPRFSRLILFSVFTAFATSTKLNGIILLVLFILVIIKSLRKLSQLKPHFTLHLTLPFLVTFSIFVTLNPFTYSHPSQKSLTLFTHRYETLAFQTAAFPQDALFSSAQRLSALFEILLHPSQFNLYPLSIPFLLHLLLGYLLLVFFLLGVTVTLSRSSPLPRTPLGVFFITLLLTSMYFSLKWPRYLIHLVIFIVYFQSLGLFSIPDSIRWLKHKKPLSRKIFPC